MVVVRSLTGRFRDFPIKERLTIQCLFYWNYQNLLIFLNSSIIFVYILIFELFNVHCLKEHILAEFVFSGGNLQPAVYLHNIRNDLLTRCQPLYHSKGFAFKIPLKDSYKCGFTRVVNKLTGHVSYYQQFDVESKVQNQSIPIKCSYRSTTPVVRKRSPYHKLVKRDSLPDDFQEEENIEILDTLQENSPEPKIAMQVRQNGQLIDGMITIIPGTPLIMEIRLNDSASNVYDLNLKYLEVSDGKDNSETIVFRGCTVDPYLFQNFKRTTNNTIQAKFRAFKFPNTAFVQFRANIQIFLRKCQIAHCLNGQGRARREVASSDTPRYEVSVGMLLRVEGFNKANEEEVRRIENHVKLLKRKNLELKSH